MIISKPVKPLSMDRDKHMVIKSEADLNMRSRHMFDLAAYIALLLISVVMFTPLISKLSLVGGDYIAHLKWAGEIEKHGKLLLPHPLYHILVILVKNIFSIDYVKSSTIVVVFAIYFLAILNYRLLAKCSSPLIAVLFSICLLVVTPLQVIYFIDGHLYFGYVGITVYHSPTMLLLKPLSLIAFCYVLKAATSTSESDLPNGIAFALSLFVCGVSKPNFLIIILPAFLMFLIVTCKLKSMLTRRYIYGAFFLPVFLVLGLQFFHTYYYQGLSLGTGNDESHVVLLPFESMGHYSSFLTVKFFLSIAFPLIVFLCYSKEFVKEKALILSSACLLMGLVLTYFFAESGYRLYAGNFWWSGQIGLYLTFLFSLVFLLENAKKFTIKKIDKIKYVLCLVMFFAHTAFGIFYYRQELLFSYAQFW